MQCEQRYKAGVAPNHTICTMVPWDNRLFSWDFGDPDLRQSIKGHLPFRLVHPPADPEDPSGPSDPESKVGPLYYIDSDRFAVNLDRAEEFESIVGVSGVFVEIEDATGLTLKLWMPPIVPDSVCRERSVYRELKAVEHNALRAPFFVEEVASKYPVCRLDDPGAIYAYFSKECISALAAAGLHGLSFSPVPLPSL